VEDFLKILEEHRRACERSGKYVEAEIAGKRLEELRAHEERRRREALRSKHIAELLSIEEANMVEFQQFNAQWDQRMAEYDLKAAELEGAMKGRHLQELAELRRKASAAVLKPKFSRELLNLRKIQETLAKQKEYKEAHRVKTKADELEAAELEKQNLASMGRMAASEDKVSYKQQQELEALRGRVRVGREDHRRQRQLDLDRLLQRYQNSKAALEKQHAKERMATDTLIRSTLGAARPAPRSLSRQPFDNLTDPHARALVATNATANATANARPRTAAPDLGSSRHTSRSTPSSARKAAVNRLYGGRP